MALKEKVTEFLKDKNKIIKYSYLISLILGLITLGLFANDLDNGSDYKNFYMIAFTNNSENRMLYFFTALIIFYYITVTAVSFISVTFFEKKDPRVKNNSMKYARLNEISTIALTGTFAVAVLVFFCLIKVFLGNNMNIGISILLGLLSFFSIFIDGVGDYFDEVQNNIRAREIIEERKKEAEEAAKLREKKQQNNKEVAPKKE